MNAWFLFECIYDVCLNDFFWWENVFMKFWTFSFWKCIFECMILFNAYIVHVWKIFSKKMLLWMHDFFLNAYMMYVWMIFCCEKMHLLNLGLFLFENTFMNAWFFFNAYIVYVWMILFYFMRKWIYEILDFFFLKIHLWMDDFFWIYFCFLFICMHA